MVNIKKKIIVIEDDMWVSSVVKILCSEIEIMQLSYQKSIVFFSSVQHIEVAAVVVDLEFPKRLKELLIKKVKTGTKNAPMFVISHNLIEIDGGGKRVKLADTPNFGLLIDRLREL